MSNKIRLSQIILPEQVADIQTLKGKQLHLTLDKELNLEESLEDYMDVISVFLNDNKTTSMSIQITKHRTLGENVTVLIISI